MRDDLLVRVVDLHGPGRAESADPALGAGPGELGLLLDPGQDRDLTATDGVRDFLASCAMDLITDRGTSELPNRGAGIFRPFLLPNEVRPAGTASSLIRKYFPKGGKYWRHQITLRSDWRPLNDLAMLSSGPGSHANSSLGCRFVNSRAFRP
jgi:hypothetical protein